MLKEIVIVGGGTAGWMTAAYLAKALGDRTRIRLIESARVRTIGVGEATFSTVKLFFDFLGLSEREWMPTCSAAYKLGIRFEGWNRTGQAFFHPFQRYESACGVPAAEWWLKLKRHEIPFDHACFTVPALCDAMSSPRYLDGTIFDETVAPYFQDDAPPPNTMLASHEAQYPYGYHFNAAELAGFLREYAVARGVSRVVDDVVEVPLAEDGSIASVRTAEHGHITGDLFVDCTGFRGLLIDQALGEPFLSFGDTLLTDSAVALQVPKDIRRDGIRPYTTAHAHSAGWSWNIPLYGRDGIGYVYCSQFLEKDEAERELLEFLGPVADGCEVSHIKMKVGRRADSWVKNCVAIGLSSGFVEPLESTGIFFIQHSVEELVQHLPATPTFDENMLASFNKSVAECIDGVREFLTMHYCASTRSDTPFWRAVQELPLAEPLAERMRIWKARLPTERNIYQPFHGFEAYSWSTMLLGLGHEPASYLPALDLLDTREAHAMFRRIQNRASYLARTLPSQYEYLTRLREPDDAPSLARSGGHGRVS